MKQPKAKKLSINFSARQMKMIQGIKDFHGMLTISSVVWISVMHYYRSLFAGKKENK